MGLVILDPNLTGTSGHHLAYDLRIAHEAVRRGQAATIVANRAAPAGTVEGVRIVPHFRDTCYADLAAADSITGRFDAFRTLNDALAEDLARLPREGMGAADCVLVPTVNENHLLGLVTWMKGFGAMDAPLFVVHLMLPSGLALDGEEERIADPQQALFYRLAFRAAAAAGGARIHFFASGRQHAAEFTRLRGTPAGVPPHPVPIAPVPPAAVAFAPAARPRALLYAGDAKLEKGLGMVPALAARLCAAHPDWSFTVQCDPANAWGGAAEALAALRAAAAATPNLDLLDERLDEPRYLALLAGADIVASTYDPAFYGCKSSGVLWESLSLGRPVIVPAGTWLEYEARQWGAGHVAYAPYGAEALAAAFAGALPELDTLHVRSAAAAERWRAANGAPALLDQIGRLWSARMLAAGLAARPRETALDLAALTSPGWHPPERLGDKPVRWTAGAPALRFDWPFHEPWELELAVRNLFGRDQIERLEARGAGGEPLPVHPSFRQGEDGALVVVTGPGRGRAASEVEVTLTLPFTRRPETETRDLGLLVTGIRLRPRRQHRRREDAGTADLPAAWVEGGGGDRAAAAARDEAHPVAGTLSGRLLADPRLPARLLLRLRCPDGPPAARRLGLYVNGVPVRLDLTAEPGEGARWAGLAEIPPAALRQGGLISAWDLVDPGWSAGAAGTPPAQLLSITARGGVPDGMAPLTEPVAEEEDATAAAPVAAAEPPPPAPPPPAEPVAPAAEVATTAAVIRWDLSRGIGSPEGPFPALDIPSPVRWVTQREATIVVDMPEAREAVMRLRYRNMVTGQTARVSANGETAEELRFNGGRLSVPGELELGLPLRGGRNLVDLGFSNSVRAPKGGRELVLLIESLDLA